MDFGRSGMGVWMLKALRKLSNCGLKLESQRISKDKLHRVLLDPLWFRNLLRLLFKVITGLLGFRV